MRFRNRSHSQFIKYLAAIAVAGALATCGGGGGGDDGPAPITSFELVDPNPGAGNRFGESVVILANGNIVVTASFDSTAAPNSGAVHLYNPRTQARIGSIFGDTGNDFLGANGVTALANGNFVITSQLDDVGGVVDAGSVMLINGTTGVQIGSTIAGDAASDQLGSGGVTALANGNFVIASPVDDFGGVTDAGSVRLINGATGAQIGSPVAGDATGDLKSVGVTALVNGNFVIASLFDDVGGLLDAGSVKLIDGATGAQIGSTIAGNAADDLLGSGFVTALANGNFVIASPVDDFGGVLNAGSVMLFNGATRAQIGFTIAGDAAVDQLGFAGVVGVNGVTALANGNFVIASSLDDVGGVVDAGSVMLINGTTGAQIGSTIAGDAAFDQLGNGSVTALASGNFVIASPNDDVGGVVNAGSVMLINGTTGAQIGSTIAGDAAFDQLGNGSVTALASGNFVIASPNDDVGGVVDAGSVMLINGTTGAQIGGTIAGDAASDRLGNGGVTALANGNFVIASRDDDVDGVVDAGSVMLINGTTGAQIGSTIAGDAAADFLASGGVTALANSNFVIASPNDDVGGVIDAGSVMLINGATGAQIGSTIAGTSGGDVLGAKIAGSAAGDFHVLGLGRADRNGLVDSGLARLIAQ